MRRHTAYTRRLCKRYRCSNAVRSPCRARWIASASLSSPLPTRKTGGAAFFGMHSVLECASRFGLRRFCTVGLARDTTTGVLPPAFAVTCMAFFLATRSVNRDGSPVLTGLCRWCRLWRRLLMGFLMSHVLLRGRRVDKSLSNLRRIECFDGLRICDVHRIQLRVA